MSGRKGWSWFERDEAAHVPDNDANALPDPDGALRKAYARCFSTADGARVLAHLRTLTLERVHGPDASVDVLRHVEGQRQLVAYVQALAERGRTGG